MTIPLYWWYIPVILVVIGIHIIFKANDWDLVTPLIGACLIVGALAFTIGHLF